VKEKTRCATTSHLGSWGEGGRNYPTSAPAAETTPIGGVAALLKALVTGALRPKGLRLAAEEVGGDEVRGGLLTTSRPALPPPPSWGHTVTQLALLHAAHKQGLSINATSSWIMVAELPNGASALCYHW
jgi:hypothetical protein